MLFVHRSHRTEALVARLVTLLDEPLDDPMTTERVLVGSAGMSRWLEGELARRSAAGICANVAFPYPDAFVARLAAEVAELEPPDPDPWSRAALTWSVVELLPELAVDGDPDRWGGVRRYLRLEDDDAGGGGATVDRRLLAFATEVARLFDRYALHRPDLVAAWGSGPASADPPTGDHGWQVELWRALAATLPVPSAAGRVQRALAVLAGGGRVPDEVPARLVAFGVSTLPPLHLRLLAAVAAQREVHLFVPSPSPAAWDGRTPRHPLLRAAGPVARETRGLVAAAADAAGVDLDEELLGADAPAPVSVLACLQRGVVDDAASGGRVAPDRSVALLDCHGPMRQVEALRDELLARLADDATLEPRDVVVLTPDVATYAPLVEAVFGARSGDAPALPVAVADGTVDRGNEVAAALSRALDLVDGRAAAPAVLDLLSTAPVLRWFGIDPADVPRVEEWVREVGVRWGRDEQDRVAAGQPAHRAHTWAAGLDRLLVGVAMADEGARTVGGVVPYDHVEDSDGLDLLDRVVAFLDVVDELRELRRARSPGAWRSTLRWLCDELTGPADGVPGTDDAVRAAHRRQRERLDRALDDLDPTLATLGEQGVPRGDAEAELGRPGLTSRSVELPALRRWVQDALRGVGGSSGFATGRVTLAGLVPLRAVPFRVVCLLGMDEGSFPRRTSRTAHDLLAEQREPGDPDARAEDRLAFLEAVLAARDGLVVSWGGRDERTGRPRPPAVPVSELLEVLDAGVEGGHAALLRRHAVLPTSPRAFDPDAPWSFDADRREAAAAAAGATAVPAPFLAGPLPSEPLEVRLDLDEVARGATDPVVTLVERRLRIGRAVDARARDDAEPLELDAFGRSRVGGRLLDAARHGAESLRDEVAVHLGRGTVPVGSPGVRQLRGVAGLAEQLAAEEQRFGPAAPLAIDVGVGAHRLVGSVPASTVGDLVVVGDTRYARLRSIHLLHAWVRHLAVCAADLGPTTSLLHRRSGSDEVETAVLVPVAPDRATALLGDWVDQHRAARHERVAFLPEVSLAYATPRCRAEQVAVEHGATAAAAATMSDEQLAEAVRPHDRGSSPLSVQVATAVRTAADHYRAWDDDGGRWRTTAWDDDRVRLVFRDLPWFADVVAATDVLPRAVRLLRPLLAARRVGKREGGRALAALAAGEAPS